MVLAGKLHHLAVLVLSDLPRGFLTVKACPDSWGGELPLSHVIPVAALCELLRKRESVLPSIRVTHGHSFYFSSGDSLDVETHRNFSLAVERRFRVNTVQTLENACLRKTKLN